MTHSEQLNELAAALAKAQAKIEGAKKDADNPFFRSKYADLASVWDACRKQLTDNGLSVVQSPYTEGEKIGVSTLLLHVSGQWILSEVNAQAKDLSPQAVGSVISYMRRYALSAMAGVPQIDDDAEAAEGRTDGKPDPKPQRMKDAGLDAQQAAGPVTIKSVDKRDGTSKQGKPYVAYTITLSNGVKCGTLDAKLANTAIEFGKNGTPVEAVTERSATGNFLNLTELIIVQPTLTQEEKDSCPF